MSGFMFAALANLKCNISDNIEVWKPIIYRNIKPDTYEVSNMGRIRNSKTGYIKKLQNNPLTGYLHCNFEIIERKTKTYPVHRIVATAFCVSSSPDKKVVNHIDGNKLNNKASNLEWVTSSENHIHALQTGLYVQQKGESVSKWPDSVIIKTCELLCTNNGSVKIVRRILMESGIDMNRTTLEAIKYKKSWRHISDKYFSDESFEKHKSTCLCENDVRLICKTLVTNGFKIKKTLTLLHDRMPYLTYPMVSSIKYKEAWVSISDSYF